MSFNATTSKFSDYIRGLPAASEADLAAGNNMPIVSASDVKKMGGENVAKGSDVDEEIAKLCLLPVRNCVTEIKVGYYWNNENVLTQNSTYSALTIGVEGGKNYSFNSTYFFSSNFCLIVAADGSVIDKLTTAYLQRADDGALYATMPPNAKYLHLSKGTTNWDAVCLSGVVDIRSATLNDYPIGRTVKVIGNSHFVFDDCEIGGVPKTFYCGSSRQYTKLKDVVEEAVKYPNSIVYIDPETFDLVQEYGQSYLDGIAHRNAGYGLILKNGVRLIFSSGSKVVFNYTGTNRIVFREFSVFNAGEGGFVIENADVESTNCRYTCHDDRGNSTDAYTNVYKNCRFIHDSSGTGSNWGPHAAIGGGFGASGNVEIVGGYYESVGSVDTITYHNDVSTTSANSKSHLSIRNVYMSGRFDCANQGVSVLLSTIQVCGCSCGAIPHYSRSSNYNDNVKLIAWNNEIRTA